MKSVRLDDQLTGRLEAASRRLGQSQSEVIREAVTRFCDSVDGDRLDVKLAPYIGVIHGGGGHIEDTAKEFTRILVEQRLRKRRRKL